MKRNLITTLILLFPSMPIFGQITCDVFDINFELDNNNLSVSLNTDLPDNTILMISVYRSYWEVGNSDEYSVDYHSERSTVQEWRNQQSIPIDNAKWETDLQEKQKELAPLGLGFDVDKISDNLTISMVVPINQPNPMFGDRNSKLTGEKVNTTGLRTVRDQVNIYHPIDGAITGESKFVDPLSLKNDMMYILSEETPLMPELNPSDPMAAVEKVKYIQTGNLIRVNSIRKIDNNPWYEVEVLNSDGNSVGKGWINSAALIRQTIERKE